MAGFFDDLNKNINKNINKPVNNFLNRFVAGEFGENGGKPIYTSDIERKARGQQSPAKAATARRVVAPNSVMRQESRGRMDLGANNPLANIVRRNSANPTPMRDGIPDMLRRPGAPDPFEELMDQIGADWGGLDRSKVDFSALDNALKARMDAINGVRTSTNQNYDRSDMNLESMHRGLQNQMRTEGAGNFNKIADTEKANLTDINSQAQGRIQAMKAEDMAKRQAMLQNLGIEASAATPDSSAEALTAAQGSIASRNEAEMVNAEQDRATNLAFNGKIADSVGQAGVERRAALQDQLQAVLGKLGMAEADAQGEYAQGKLAMERDAEGRQYQQWRDRQGFLQDTLGMMQEDAQAQLEAATKGAEAPEIGGFSGLAQDLMNTGYDPQEIQNAMGALADITGGDYMKGVDPNSGYDQAAILNKALRGSGIDRMLALQLATNYSNLGNTSKYQQQY